MFCRKCGKEIENGSRFCPYCGCDMQESPNPKWDTEPKDGTHIKTEGSKKWIILAGVVAGVAVIGMVSVLAVNHFKGKTADTKSASTEKVTAVDKNEDKPIGKSADKPVEKINYPQDITLDDNVQVKLTELIDLLCKLDSAQNGENFIKEKEINSAFATSFLIDSIWFKVPFEEGRAIELDLDFQAGLFQNKRY